MIDRPRTTVLIVIALAVTTVAAYAGVFTSDFVTYDDDKYVVGNRHVRAGLTAAGINYAWTTFDCSNWHPVTWLSLELDSTLFAVSPGAYHAVNLAWHLVNVVLLFLILQRMTCCTWPGAIVAALFAVHPLHVESVAWISERKDVLSTFFLLLAILAYERYCARPGVARYLPVAGSMAIGLLCKPMLVTLPCLLLLLDCWPLNRLWSKAAPITDEAAKEESLSRYQPCSVLRAILEKVPLLMLSAASSAITIAVQKSGGAVESLATLPLSNRLANAIQAYTWYLGKTFWPTNLAVFYPHLRQSLTWQGTTISLVILIAISIYVLRAARSRPHLAVGWLWFLGALVPTIGLLQVGLQAYADRYAYVPHIGLFVMVVWEAAYLARSVRLPRFAISSLAVAAILICTGLTMNQVQYWHNGEALMTHALDVTGDNWLAHSHLGMICLHEKRLAEAEEHLTSALQGRPNSVAARNNLAQILIDQGRFEDAEKQLEISLRLDKRLRRALLCMGQLREKQGRLAEAVECYRELVTIRPDYWVAHYQLGTVLSKQGRSAEAIKHWNTTLRLNPGFEPAIAALEAEMKRVDSQLALSAKGNP